MCIRDRGLISAIRKGKLADNVLTVAGMIGVAIPQFLFGVFCIILFLSLIHI